MAKGKAAKEAAADAAAQVHPADAIRNWWANVTQPEMLAKATQGLISFIVVVAIAAIVYGIVMAVFRRAIARVERELTDADDKARKRGRHVVMILELLRSVAKWVIIIIAVIWGLADLGINVLPLLTGAGIAGIAVAFGAQSVVKDLMSGVLILLEGQYTVGDYIQVGGNFGRVEGVGVRTTILRDLDNQLHYIPNGSVGQVTVYEEPYVNYVIDVPIADAERATEAVEIVSGVGEQTAGEYPRFLPCRDDVTTVNDDGNALIRFPMAAFPTQDWIAKDELPTRIKQALAKQEISIAEGHNVRIYEDISRMPE